MATKKSLQKKIKAVLLADSFMTPNCFRPMTKSIPKVLLPLVNVPMLEYTLEFLSTAHVDEIIIFAASHADQIQNYINNTRWLHKEPELKVKVIVSAESRSVGDALRYLDQLDVIKGDFLLLTGDVVSNIDLNPIIMEHRQRSSENPEITMTMLFTTVKPGHAMRSRTNDLLLATDRVSKRILHYSDNIQHGFVDFNPDFFASGKNGINVQSNAFDTGIIICNPRLLTVFSDQFDYKTVREDYLSQQLNLDPDSAIPPDHIHAHFVAPGAYASRIVDMRTYHTCSHDILRKWVSPLIVSNNVLIKTSYKSFPNNIYREDKVTLSHTTLLKSDCVIGRHTKMGFSTLLHKTIVGRNVTIGNSCSLTTCYVLDGATIGDGCVLNGAFIGKNVVIGKNVTIHKGAVLDTGVILADNVVVPPYVSITASQSLDDAEQRALDNEMMRIRTMDRKLRYMDVSTVFKFDNTNNNNDLISSQPGSDSSPNSDDDHYNTARQPFNKLTPEQCDLLDKFPVDPRTFFYNNETQEELAHRINTLSKSHINIDGFDEYTAARVESNYAPRLMLPSIEVLQLDSSPHQVFSKQTMTSILNEAYANAHANDNCNNDDIDDDVFFNPSPMGSNYSSQSSSTRTTMMYNQCDIAKNFSPYTNKGYEALVSSNQRKKQQNANSSTFTDGSLTMLSPSALQQTLTNNVQEVNRALSLKLPYYPLSDLSVLHSLPPEVVVGQGGVGRLYLHPPHPDFGRAIVLLNSTAPPAYLCLQNYPLLTKTEIISQTIEPEDDDADYDDYDDEDYYDGEGDDYHDMEFGVTTNNNNTTHNNNNMDDDSDDENQALRPPMVSRQSSLIPQPMMETSSSATATACTQTLAGARSFIGEIISSMKRALQGERVANIIQELPTLRLVYRDVGFDVYIAAGFLGIFAMANFPPPSRGLYKESKDYKDVAWPKPEKFELKPATLAVVKLFKVWAPIFKPTNSGDPLTLLLPALTTACLLDPLYASLYPILLNQLYGIDYLPGEDILEYNTRIASHSTLHTTAKSLLPSIVEYNSNGSQTILGFEVLTKLLAPIIEMLEDEDEDEDDEDDE